MSRKRRMRRDFGSNEPAGRGKRRLRWVADMRDGRGRCRHSKTIRGTKTDGDRYLARVQAMYDVDPLTLPPGAGRPCPTVGEAWETWVLPELRSMEAAYRADPRPSERGKRDRMKTSTLAQALSTWRRHVGPRWAEVRASDVTYSDVQAWLDTKTEMVGKRALTQLRLVLSTIVRNGLLDRNVARDDFRMPTAAKRYDHGLWTLEELDEVLWPAFWGEPAEAAFILSAFDGARTGECLAPRLDEIGAMERGGMTFAVVPFRRQVHNDGSVSVESDLKNRWSPRVTVLPPPWSLRVLQLRDEALARGETWLSDRGDGTPMSQQALRRSYYKCLDGAGADRRQFRALRRSWRSWISSKGISTEILEKMMGHSDGSTTSRFYLQADAGTICEELARAHDWSGITLSWDKLGRV